MSIVRATAWALGLGRAGFGAVLVGRPKGLATAWVGPETAEQPTAQVVIRSLGARDFLIGCGTVLALVRGRGVRGWFLAGALIDVYDTVSTFAAKDHLSRRSLTATAALAGGAAAAGALVAARPRAATG
jgi:hypothetical protein